MNTIDSNAPRVVVFRELLLPPSETFVLAQAAALQRYTPVRVGLIDVPRSLPVPDPLMLTTLASPLSRLHLEAYRRLPWAPAFHRSVRRTRPALMHAHFAIDAANGLGLHKLLKVPMVVTLHGFDVTTHDEQFAKNRGGRRFLRRRPELWKRAATFVCVSQAIRRVALDVGYPEEKLTVQYIGIDCDQFQPAPAAERHANQILFVGRLVEKKGCEYLVRAAAQLRDRRIDCRLTIIGDGPLRAEIEGLASSLQLPAEFLGTQPPEVVRAQMRRARVLCNPSVTAANGDQEGLGMVFAEAQAMGLPVVSTRHSGLPEVVLDGETGLLAQERSVEELTHHLDRMLRDQRFWLRCSEQGVRWIRQTFNVLTCTAALESIYDLAREGKR